MTGSDSTATLVNRAQEGDQRASDALVRAHLKPAYAVALAIVKQPAEAEDVAQDALIKAIERLDSCRDPDRFGAWLYKIVRNQAFNRLARRRVRRAFSIGGAELQTGPGPTDALGLRSRILEALRALPRVRAEVVLLHDLGEWTHAEIGDALNISELMSRQHLFVARKALRKRLADDDLRGEP